MSTRLILATGLVLMLMVVGSCTSPSASFDSRLGAILKPYQFSIASWELRAIPTQIKQLFDAREQVGDEIGTVREYFSRVDQIKVLKSEINAVNEGKGQGTLATLEAELGKVEGQNRTSEETVGRILARQIKETLAEQGIFNPVDSLGLRATFPPVNFKLDEPPHMLVISPRDRIESIRQITLHQDITLGQMESVEASVDALGIASLVVELGGFGGTYPTFVINNADLRFILDTATEEWLHQYLAFKPLGFRYVLDLLGISKDYEIVTINETVASMVSKEIGSLVYRKYYADLMKSGKPQPADKFDFNREMREIRQAIDKLLAEGEIEPAEKFMEQKRQYLAANGYYIRKLNQAYFAFHGTYADSPTSISPIGVELKKLRSQSASLKDFLSTVAVMTSRQDLASSLK